MDDLTFFRRELRPYFDRSERSDVKLARFSASEIRHLSVRVDEKTTLEFDSRCVDITVEGTTRTAYQPFTADTNECSLDLAIKYAKATDTLACMYSVEVPYVDREDNLKTTRYFLPFDSLALALKFTSHDMHGFEYTLTEGARYAYMDVERENVNEITATEVDILAAVFVVCKYVFPLIGHKLDMDQVGILRASRKNKYSFHVIFRNVIFPSHEVERLFKLTIRDFLKDPPAELKPIVDEYVNYTKLNVKGKVMHTTTIDLCVMGRCRGQMRAPLQTKVNKPDSALHVLKGSLDDVWTYGYHGGTIPEECVVHRE